MVFDRQFLDLMTETITIQHLVSTSTDGYAVPSYGAAITAKARLEQILKTVKSKEGQEVQSDLTAYIAPFDTSFNAITITNTDLLTMPSGYQTSPLTDALRHNDDQGLMYWEVQL